MNNILYMLFSPWGRIRRRDVWIYSLGIAATELAARFAIFSFLRPRGSFWSAYKVAEASHMNNYIAAYAAITVFSEVPRFFIDAKRWHDRGKSAWLAALARLLFLTQYFGIVVFHLVDLKKSLLLANLILLPVLGMLIWTFVECGCLDGNTGPNRYGPSPKLRVDPADNF